MRHIHTSFHPDIKDESGLEGKTYFERRSSRGIILNGEDILLLFTERYNDYSLPGGGIDEGEDIVEGLARELKEETGAEEISNIKEFGVYEDYRPWYKDDFDIQHIVSYLFTCSIEGDLGDPKLEHYEVSNGMKPIWVNIHDALRHNEETLANCSKQGMSIVRETYILRLIIKELL